MDLFAIAEGPLVWVAFAVFLGGVGYRAWQFWSESRTKDKVMHAHWKWKWVFATWFKWLFPANETVKKTPLFTLAGYLFHACLLLVPVFCYQHVMMWELGSLGWSWPTLPAPLADWMTLAVIGVGVWFILRRAFNPDVKLLTTGEDYLILAVTILPFLTGWLSAHSAFDPKSFLGANMQLIHILSGELMLVLIPFTKLSHFILFFFSRAAIGVEFGRREYSV